MKQKIEIKPGDKFGRLTVIKQVASHRTSCGRIQRKVLCQCVCGNQKEIVFNYLMNGKTTSCGCYRIELTIRKGHNNRKHGQKGTRIYNIWIGRKQRCFDVNSKDYSAYGGRGIKVCDEWLNDFQSFYNWTISNGYSDELSIDRINNDGNYEPSNCRWATAQQQRLNQGRRVA